MTRWTLPHSTQRLSKLCGLRRVQDIEAATEAGADLIGLVFAPSRRRVTPEEARAMLEAVPRHPPAVGVFVNAGASSINEIAAYVGLRFAQLSGSESPDDAREIAVPYIKVLHVGGTPTGEEMHIINSHRAAAGFIIDSPSPLGGGSGQRADWDTAAALIASTDRPVLLAGGLTPQNVTDGLVETNAYGADVSGGVERDGWKDAALMRAFVQAVKRVARAAPYTGNERATL